MESIWSLNLIGIELFKVFYCFFIYGTIGWIWESTYASLNEGELINRGFLNGPFIPIYGCAASGILLVFYNPLTINLTVDKSFKTFVIIFLLGSLTASVIEYVTSFVMEKLFHAKWWDYSNMPLNINGRVSLVSSMFWGLMSLLLVRILHPFILRLIGTFPRKPAEIVGTVIFVIFVIDLVATTISAAELDKKISAIGKIKDQLINAASSINIPDSVGGVSKEYKKRKDAAVESVNKILKENKEFRDAQAGKFLKFSAVRFFKAFPTLKLPNRQWVINEAKKIAAKLKKKE